MVVSAAREDARSAPRPGACLASVGMGPPFLECRVAPTSLLVSRTGCRLRHTTPRMEVRLDPASACPSSSPRQRSVRRFRSGPTIGAGPVAARHLVGRRRTHRCLWRNGLWPTVGPSGVVRAGCPRGGRALARPAQAAALASRPGTSTRMPGPMVDATVRLLKYWPLAALGRARLMASVRAARLSTSWSGSKVALPNGDVDDAALVDLELDAAALDLVDGALEVEGDRARLGVGHEAATAQDATQLADACPSCRGWRRRRRTPASRPRCVSTRSSAPTTSAPAALASGPCRPGRRRRRGRPCPCHAAATTVPRTICSAWRGSTPRRMCASTEGSNLTVEVSLQEGHGLQGLVDPAGLDELGELQVPLAVLAHVWIPPCGPEGLPLRRGVDVPACGGCTRPAPAGGMDAGVSRRRRCPSSGPCPR